MAELIPASTTPSLLLSLAITPPSHSFPTRRSSDLVLAYRMILFWLPLIAGGVAFAALRRDMPTGGELAARSEEHTSELQSPEQRVCRLLLEKKKTKL